MIHNIINTYNRVNYAHICSVFHAEDISIINHRYNRPIWSPNRNWTTCPNWSTMTNVDKNSMIFEAINEHIDKYENGYELRVIIKHVYNKLQEKFISKTIIRNLNYLYLHVTRELIHILIEYDGERRFIYFAHDCCSDSEHKYPDIRYISDVDSDQVINLSLHYIY